MRKADYFPDQVKSQSSGCVWFRGEDDEEETRKKQQAAAQKSYLLK